MAISLKPEHLKRYKDIALLLVKHGRADLVKSAGLDAAIEGEQDGQVSPAKMEELASDIERMGPTFIKLAQLMSTRADLLPQAYIDALTRLQDKVGPFPFTEVEQIVNTELGVRISKAFADFDSQPMAAASLGQVHRALMRDGRDVVVKVQRPGIREEMSKDLEVLGEIASFLDAHTEAGRKYEFTPLLEEFRKSLLHELDYRLEARNLAVFADNLRDFARVSPRFQENLIQLLLSISEGRGDETADMTIKMGEPKLNFDEKSFRRSVSDLVLQSQNAQLENIDAGRVVLRITQISGDCNFRLPPDFTMIAKTLLNLDQVVHTLDPKFDPNFAIRNYANVIMQRRMQKALSAGNLYGTVLELKDFAQKFPSRINQLVDTLTNRGIKIEVDAIDERSLLASLHKIANRITIGLLLAALIVGAALMMRVETSFKILGYPGIAIIFFLLAAIGALVLVFNILFRDERHKGESSDSQ